MVARDPADLVADAFELQKVSDPHTEPYKSKYESSSLLREARLALSASERSNEEGTEDAVAVALLACQEGASTCLSVMYIRNSGHRVTISFNLVQIRDPSPPDEANFGALPGCLLLLTMETYSLML